MREFKRLSDIDSEEELSERQLFPKWKTFEPAWIRHESGRCREYNNPSSEKSP